MEKIEKFLDTRQVAEMLNLSTQTVVNLRYQGRGPAYHKIGRRVIYARDDVREFLKARRVDPERS